MIARVHFISFH